MEKHDKLTLFKLPLNTAKKPTKKGGRNLSVRAYD